MSWKITHLDMNCFIMRRMLLHSPKLHTVEKVIQSCIATISVEFQRLFYFLFPVLSDGTKIVGQYF